MSAAGSLPVDLGKRSSLEAVVRASLDAGLDRLLDHDYRLRLHADNPPAHDIHQARVATRRLRSDLKTFRPALDPIWVRHTRDELRWLGSALGSVRDVDVLMSGLSSEDGASPTDAAGQRELLGHLSEQRLSACQQLAEVMDDARYLLLLDRLHAAGQRSPFRLRGAPVTRRRRARLPRAPLAPPSPAWWADRGAPYTSRYAGPGTVPPTVSCTGSGSRPSSSAMPRKLPCRYWASGRGGLPSRPRGSRRFSASTMTR